MSQAVPSAWISMRAWLAGGSGIVDDHVALLPADDGDRRVQHPDRGGLGAGEEGQAVAGARGQAAVAHAGGGQHGVPFLAGGGLGGPGAGGGRWRPGEGWRPERRELREGGITDLEHLAALRALEPLGARPLEAVSAYWKRAEQEGQTTIIAPPRKILVYFLVAKKLNSSLSGTPAGTLNPVTRPAAAGWSPGAPVPAARNRPPRSTQFTWRGRKVSLSTQMTRSIHALLDREAARAEGELVGALARPCRRPGRS